MTKLMDKHAIIKLKEKGISNRKVATMLGINRKTIAKYWNEYVLQKKALKDKNSNIKEIQERICEIPKYNSDNRNTRKYTEQMDTALNEILESEIEKCKELGINKQQLTILQIHQLLLDQGFKISYSTISTKIRNKRHKSKECFIKQIYDFGDRLEYDFGEVKLFIDGKLDTYHIAVLSSPASNFRWAYLYRNQKQDVFMHSHVKFFDMIGGIYKEVVYDNMRNVVSKFIGKHEKELNKNLLNLSLYYGFDINVTNCFSGNEKGHVEGSVKVIRNKVFALTYKFKSFEDAKLHLHNKLIILNENSDIMQEQKHLLPVKPKLDLAKMTLQKVNKYSFIRVDNNYYSVPDELINKTITVKTYYNKLCVYEKNKFVCEHNKIDGLNEISIDIKHYLKSLNKKPGAIKNSQALKSIPKLKTIYDTYFTKNPKKFIELIQKNKENNMSEIIRILEEYSRSPIDILSYKNKISQTEIDEISQNQVSKYNELCLKEMK